MSSHPVDVLEAAYQLDGDDRTWLERVATAIRPFLDDGHGMFAYRFDATRPFGAWRDSIVAFGDSEPMLSFMSSFASPSGERFMKDVYIEPPRALEESGCEKARSAGYDLASDPRWISTLAHYGATDSCALHTVEPGPKSLAFFAPHAGRRFDPRTRRVWARVSAHLAAARRLRESLSTGVEAVFAPSGKLEHVEGGAEGVRERLREAVLRQERSRTQAGRRDPETAIEAWTALVAGRWSLVDQFERGGRRYVVARRNPLGVTDPRALNEPEREIVQLAALGKSNKLIAYELGLAESTVGTHLTSARRKLGVTTRAELVKVVAGVGTS